MIELVKSIENANCITHNGTMHADEVFATAFLSMYLKDVKVCRVSNVNVTELKDDIMVYDVGRDRFDHHQEDALKRENGITYSSFGLLWNEFGKEYLKQQNIENIDEVFAGVDKDFVEMIDAIDNGIFPKIEASYKVKTLSDVIKLFNPSYQSEEIEDNQFIKAVTVAKLIFEEEILQIIGKVKAKQKILNLIENNKNNYLLLDEYLPYEETILNSETANNIYFVIFPSNRGGYAIKTIPKSTEDKTFRMEIPKQWAGLIDEELEQVSGIKGLTFCHNNRFILSCQNEEIAIKTVKKIIEMQEIEILTN